MPGSPERALWCAVIEQAIADATWFFSRTHEKIASESAVDWRENAQARAWFSLGNSDFKKACYLAGFDPEEIVTLAKKEMALADAFIESLKEDNGEEEK